MTVPDNVCHVCGTRYVCTELGYGHCPQCSGLQSTITILPYDDNTYPQLHTGPLAPPTVDYECPRCDLDYESAVKVWGYKPQ